MEPAGGQPRYGRIALVCAAGLVTTVALLGGLGLIDPEAPARADDTVASVAGARPSPSTAPSPSASERPGEDDGQDGTADTDSGGTSDPGRSGPGRSDGQDREAAQQDRTLPPTSGQGRRVVFSEGRQRVWLVGADDRVRRTYLVSGSIYDNLEPGRYAVWSRSENAVGVGDSGTMRFFVRFARGDTGAAIGFHDIPIDDGKPVQTIDQLGTPLSHGCIRQRRADAIRMWRFAPIGTRVVVTP